MSQDNKNKISILILAIVLFVPFLGGVHLFDWDEINFAEIAREMILSGDYLRPQINFEPFWEKPPLFIWLQVLSMKIFGINDFAARFPNSLCGIVSLLTIYSIGKKYRDEKLGMWWVLVYVGSILPHLYFRSGIIDPWFNLFIFLGIYFYLQFRAHNGNSALTRIALSGIFIGLAVLTKGPVALMLFGLSGFFFGVYVRFNNWIRLSAVFVFLISFCITVGLWYGAEIAMNGTWFITEFITYQIRLLQTKDAGHGGFPGYHLVVLLFGCFPASAFAIRSLLTSFNAPSKAYQIDFRKMMKVLFWVVLFVFSGVNTKIVHYSSLAYFPLTFLAAEELYRLSIYREKPMFISQFLLAFIGGLLVIVSFAFPILLNHRDVAIPFMKDPFAVESLQAQISTPWYIYLAGCWIFLVILCSHIWVRKANPEKGYKLYFLGNAISVALLLYLFIGRAEMFSQNAHIEFLKEAAAKKIPVQTIGFKSYAQYYYGNSTRHIPGWEEIMEKGFSEDMYLVAKVNKEEEFDKNPLLEKVGRKNGFVFYLKKADHGTQ